MVAVDTNGDPVTTVNSSTATLAMPPGAVVLFAGLYWAADQSAGNNNGTAPPAATPNVRAAKFRKAPGSAYRSVTATTLDSGHRWQQQPLSGLHRRHGLRRGRRGRAPTPSATCAREPAATATPAGRWWWPTATRCSRRAT